MMIGPEPMINTLLISVLFGIKIIPPLDFIIII
jgi:hypothetical protein